MKRCVACASEFEGGTWECPSCRAAPATIDGFCAFAPALNQANAGFKESYFAGLAELEHRNFWFRARNRLITWALARYFPDARRFLEVGCGTGFVLSGVATAFPRMQLTGTEISTTGLMFARERLPRAELFQADALNMPFAAEFDVIGAFDVLEHIEDDEKALAEMYRALRPGGGIMISVPQHRFLWSRQDEYACHVRRYEATEIEDRMRSAGFSLLKSTSFVTLLMPLMLISRWRRRRNQDFDPWEDLRLNPVLDTALGGVMHLECALIRSGADFAFGGSRLVVAQKRRA